MQHVDLNAHLIEIRNLKPDLQHLQIKRQIATSVNSRIWFCMSSRRERSPKHPIATVYDQAGIQRIQRRKLSASETKRSFAGALTRLQVF